MRVCVCGFYYRPEFYKSLRSGGIEYNGVGKVAGKYADIVIPNRGLEWAAYDYYVKNIWDGEDVFFTHDDVAATAGAFNQIAEIEAPCAFIFRDEEQALANGGSGFRRIGIHGRAFKMAGGLIAKLGGFWFDENNTGFTSNPIPAGVQDYNMGVINLYDRLIEIGCKIENVFITEYDSFKRGRC